MPHVISYDRVSKPQQTRGHGLDRQKTDAEKYADRMGWTIDTSLSFADKGMSAFRSKHAKEGNFAAFLAMVASGVIKPGTILLVEHLDRLSRDKVRVARDQFEKLLDAGIEIVTTANDRHYTAADLDDLMGLMEPLWTMYLAHEESLKKSNRLKKMFASARLRRSETKAVRGANVPAWVRIVGGKYVGDVNKCDTIRLIFKLCNEGRGAHQIVRHLNENNVANIGGKAGKDRWNTTYVQNLLRDRRLLGECQQYVMSDGKRVPSGLPILGYYPAVVTPEMYHTAQGAKTTRTVARGRAGTGVPNLFTGIIFDHNGCTMQSWTKSSANKSRYITSSAARARREGPYVSFPYQLLEGEILAQVVELTVGDLSGERSTRLAKIAALEGEVAGLTERIGRITSSIEDDPTPELMSLVSKMNGNRKLLVENLEKIQAEVVVTGDHLSECQKLISEMAGDVDIRRQVKARLPHVIERIIVSLSRTEKRAVAATVTVRWRRGDVSVLHLHSRDAYRMSMGETDRLGIGADDVVHDGAERVAGILKAGE